jgi:hypothetical protein
MFFFLYKTGTGTCQTKEVNTGIFLVLAFEPDPVPTSGSGFNRVLNTDGLPNTGIPAFK